jgi:hypothetical protein
VGSASFMGGAPVTAYNKTRGEGYVARGAAKGAWSQWLLSEVRPSLILRRPA